jgi:hypothetical protein
LALSNQFDPIFRKYAGRLPVAYLRALSKRESNQNPRETDGPAWGLMQVIEVVRTSYNKRRGTNFSRSDLLDPDTNVRIATDLLNRIVGYYAKFVPNAPNMQEDWHNPEFVKLLTAGWNSGYSAAAGVIFVARCLESRGIPVTHDNVIKHAQSCGGTRHLYKHPEQTLSWQRSVMDLYFQQPDLPTATGSILLTLGATAFVVWGVYKLMRD